MEQWVTSTTTEEEYIDCPQKNNKILSSMSMLIQMYTIKPLTNFK